MDDWGTEELLPIVLEVGEVNLKCMAMLDRANTETFGHPRPTEASLTVEKGPFIVVIVTNDLHIHSQIKLAPVKNPHPVAQSFAAGWGLFFSNGQERLPLVSQVMVRETGTVCTVIKRSFLITSALPTARFPLGLADLEEQLQELSLICTLQAALVQAADMPGL